MEIVREFKRPVSSKVIVNIPEKFVETELEILIIPVNENLVKERKTIDKMKLFEKLCGLWENRKDVTLEEIRNKAWRRT